MGTAGPAGFLLLARDCPVVFFYIVNTSLMRIVCLRSYTDWPTQDQIGFLVQRLNGWFEPSLFDVEYYVPEDRAYMLYLIDPNIEPIPQRDYIA